MFLPSDYLIKQGFIIICGSLNRFPMRRVFSYFCFLIAGISFNSTSFSQPFPLLENLQTAISHLINTTKPSIVTITSQSKSSFLVEKNEGISSLLKEDQENKKNDLWMVGSGIIYSPDGYIITKSSVLWGFEKIKVTLFDKTDYEAEYIGSEESTGLAVLKIDAEQLTPVNMTDSDNTPIYALALVLGNSLGLSPYASFGIINGKTNQQQFIISAALNPGSASAGVFNLRGELMGIISAQIEADAWTMGPALAENSRQNGIVLASNQIRHVADGIIKMHHEQKGWLGVDIFVDSLASGKIVISNIIEDSPADRSGLKKGDWILKYNESLLKDVDQFASLIEQSKPGRTVSLDFIRNNRQLKVFPQIAVKRSANFSTDKPGKISARVQTTQTEIPQPIIISPERFNQMNLWMRQMENELNRLKAQVREHQP